MGNPAKGPPQGHVTHTEKQANNARSAIRRLYCLRYLDPRTSGNHMVFLLSPLKMTLSSVAQCWLCTLIEREQKQAHINTFPMNLFCRIERLDLI